MAVLFHTRVTRPLVGMLMVVFGLSVILANPNRHVIISSGMCLLASAGMFLFVIASKYLGDQDVLPAALAAWLPVIVFGPPSLVAARRGAHVNSGPCAAGSGQEVERRKH